MKTSEGSTNIENIAYEGSVNYVDSRAILSNLSPVSLRKP